MENHSLKSVRKLPSFKIKINKFEIECTNFLRFEHHDFMKLLTSFLIGFHFFMIVMNVPLSALLLYYFPKISLFTVIPYYFWIFLDWKTPYSSGRKYTKKWFTNNSLLTYYRDYFPSNLIKTCELPANQNYLLAVYPHGVIPLNVIPHFLTNAYKVDEIFPKLDFRFVAHEGLFYIPIIRDLFLAFGGHAVSESSIKFLLSSQPSKGVLIFPGGAADISLVTTGNVYKIKMSNRKGFVRMALITGTPLVPVFNFGEKNTYEVRIIYPIKHRIFKNTHGSDLFLPKGRGIFQNHFGLMPKQCPTNIVVGEPIYVPKVQNPSVHIIDEYHNKFSDALFALFEKYKHCYDVAGSEAKLIMV